MATTTSKCRALAAHGRAADGCATATALSWWGRWQMPQTKKEAIDTSNGHVQNDACLINNSRCKGWLTWRYLPGVLSPLTVSVPRTRTASLAASRSTSGGKGGAEQGRRAPGAGAVPPVCATAEGPRQIPTQTARPAVCCAPGVWDGVEGKGGNSGKCTEK